MCQYICVHFCKFLLYKALGLLVSVQSQNYPSQNMCEQSQLWPHFATSQLHTMEILVKSLNLNLAHSLTTHPSYAAKWSNKEGDYAAGHSPDHQIPMMRGFLQSLLRSLRLRLEPDRALSQLEQFTQYRAV